MEEAHRSHPVIVDAVSYQGSARYAGREHADSMFAAELPQLAGQSITTVFTALSMSRLRATSDSSCTGRVFMPTRPPVLPPPPSAGSQQS